MTLLVEDRELLARFRDGHPEALDQVYRHYAPRVAAFLRAGFVHSNQQHSAAIPGRFSPLELESAVQEVFVRAFSAQARMAYDGLRPYIGFLYGIARNVALDERRRHARRSETVESPEIMEQYQARAGGAAFSELALEPADPGPGEAMDRRRAHELVRAFLDEECDARDRSLYELRYGEELSQDAAAQEAGLTRIQVRRWESKFRERLLRYLKRADYVP